MGTHHRLALGLALTGMLLGGGGAADAAPPDVPQTLSYQGVLLDAGGQPQTGNVDLTLRLYDALSGGTLLYKQSFPGVTLTDGVFSVRLGPSGSATDTPTHPLTTGFADALTGDLAATGPDRFLEITVGASGALPRTQILSVPYSFLAVRADSAATADEASQLGGVPSEVLSQVFEHFNFDGGPPNDDPLEGLGDVDGDGIANFVDFDNDGDGVSDADEVAQGSGVNLVTPVITNVQPPSGTWSGATVTVTGLNFEPGLSVEVGTQTPAPQNVTPTAFEVSVGPQPKGSAPIQVTRLNGETDSAPFAFAADQAHGLTWSAGRKLDIAVRGAQRLAVALFTGRVDTDSDSILDTPIGLQTGGSWSGPAVGWSPSGLLAALDVTVAGPVFYVDDTGNFLFKPTEGILIQSSGSAETIQMVSGSIAFDPAGRRVAAYLLTLDSARHAFVAHDRDGDASFAGPNEVVQIEAVADPAPDLGEVAVDASGRVAYAWYDEGADLLRLAWDRSGDGDYDDTVAGNPELATVAAPPALECLGLAFDGSGVLSLVYAPLGSPALLARDFDGDGDFASAGESVALGAAAATGCAVSGGGGPGIAVVDDGGGTLTLRVDRNGDDDFDDPDEVRILGLPSAGPYAPLAVARGTTGRSFVATRSDVFHDLP